MRDSFVEVTIRGDYILEEVLRYSLVEVRRQQLEFPHETNVVQLTRLVSSDPSSDMLWIKL